MSSEKYIPFFRRQQSARGELPETFSYDLPKKIRNQVIMLWQKVPSTFDKRIVKYLRNELGEFTLPFASEQEPNILSDFEHDYYKELEEYFLNVKDAEYALTVVELMCREAASGGYSKFVTELNERFQLEAIGYKVDVIGDRARLRNIEDEDFSANVIEPCLSVLSNYPTAQKHYLDAYEELKKKKYDDAMTDLGQAMESLLKTRFKQTRILFNEKDALGKLLDTAQKHIECSDFSFHRFKELILNVGQGRNNSSHGHAESCKPKIDAVYTRFMINQASANLLFLAEITFQTMDDHMSLKRICKDTINIWRNNSVISSNVKASVQNNKLYIMDGSIDLKNGDIIEHPMSNGNTDKYKVKKHGYSSGIGRIKPHYQASITPLNEVESMKPTTVTNISITGNGNTIAGHDLTDNSVTIKKENPYELLRMELMKAELTESARTTALQTVKAMELHSKEDNPDKGFIELLAKSLPTVGSIASIIGLII